MVTLSSGLSTQGKRQEPGVKKKQWEYVVPFHSNPEDQVQVSFYT